MAQTLARLIVFTTSAAVLVIEILAARILAPYLGVSLEVFTGIIGVILAGISIGAWLGGRAADRTDPRAMLGPLLVTGGLSAMASPLIVDGIGPSLSTGPTSIVTASLLGFFLPAALLSAVTPVVVKIRLSSLEETGSVVGSYSAIGTAGAIFGTFVTGFVLIAAFPTRPIVAVLGVALTLSGILLWSTKHWREAGAGLGVMLGLGAVLIGVDGPCQVETTYHCAIVETDQSRPSGRILILDRLFNSYVDLEDPTHLEFRYIQVMADVIETETSRGPINVVSIGGGGFTLPGYVEATRPGSDNIVLEIDPILVDIGETSLALDDDIEVVVDDARISIQRIPDASADVVIGDAFSGASVPWHLTTVEFVSEVDRILDDDGVYTMNVIDRGRLRFARAATRTLMEVFDHVTVLAPPSYFDGRGGGNFVLVASRAPLDLPGLQATIRQRGGSETGLSGGALDEWVDGSLVLTDDYAPVDQLLGRL